jgi:hypothetical protein
MSRVLPAPFAELIQFDLALNFPLVLAGPIIDSLANFALQLYQIFLRHIVLYLLFILRLVP